MHRVPKKPYNMYHILKTSSHTPYYKMSLQHRKIELIDRIDPTLHDSTEMQQDRMFDGFYFLTIKRLWAL